MDNDIVVFVIVTRAVSFFLNNQGAIEANQMNGTIERIMVPYSTTLEIAYQP